MARVMHPSSTLKQQPQKQQQQPQKQQHQPQTTTTIFYNNTDFLTNTIEFLSSYIDNWLLNESAIFCILWCQKKLGFTSLPIKNMNLDNEASY